MSCLNLNPAIARWDHVAFTLSSRKEKSDETGADDGEILWTVADSEGRWLVATVDWVAPFVLMATWVINRVDLCAQCDLCARCAGAFQ